MWIDKLADWCHSFFGGGEVGRKKKKPKDEDRIWRGIRNSKIRRRFKEGDTARMLAHDFGLSTSQIHRILAKGDS